MEDGQDGLPGDAVDESGRQVADAGAVALEVEAVGHLDVENRGGFAVGRLEVAKLEDFDEDAVEGAIGNRDGMNEQFGGGTEDRVEQIAPGLAGIRGLEEGLEIHGEVLKCLFRRRIRRG